MKSKWKSYTRTEIRNIIYSYLKSVRVGLTIAELSLIMDISRKVVSEELNNLVNEENSKVVIMKEGQAKVFILKKYYKRFIPKWLQAYKS